MNIVKVCRRGGIRTYNAVRLDDATNYELLRSNWGARVLYTLVENAEDLRTDVFIPEVVVEHATQFGLCEQVATFGDWLVREEGGTFVYNNEEFHDNFHQSRKGGS